MHLGMDMGSMDGKVDKKAIDIDDAITVFAEKDNDVFIAR